MGKYIPEVGYIGCSLNMVLINSTKTFSKYYYDIPWITYPVSMIEINCTSILLHYALNMVLVKAHILIMVMVFIKNI